MFGSNHRLDTTPDLAKRTPRARAVQAKPVPAAATPPPLPLDAAEADLCARLRGAMATPPKRVPLVVTPPVEPGIKPAATPPEIVAEPHPLPPLIELPPSDAATGAPALRAIGWVQRSRRRKLSAAIRAAPAWLVTLAVIGGTLAGMLIMVLGTGRSLELAQRVPGALSGAMIAVKSATGL